ncbi:MAG: UDP-N-acetylglucosamine diphosphorylase/glucosamine-phosphate N-acetyltransferase [Pseudomonadota bacterium]|jgi:bifunctional UDP-N-acetylglucosamine pyrophosphorylase/glucosamine-1-phosphate N-acetyltransferase|nr:bifunctional UDP-N-acetylglucosamine diphosphorylase/glucosamine-1-phosphate N-acetyltransferase GlmU [Burkholderiales bacterium]
MQDLDIVILAAGLGKRMNSSLPKVLHKIGDKAMLSHVVSTALKLNPSKIIIVYGFNGDKVKQEIEQDFPQNNFLWAPQAQQLGTGDAVKSALNYISKQGKTLLLYGDVPLIDQESLTTMINKFDNNVVMLVAKVDDPSGYGRVVRNEEGMIVKIVEEKDAKQSEKFINEINTGFYIFPNVFLPQWLAKLSNNNQQHEYYVTDLIAMASAAEIDIDYVEAKYKYNILGVNNKEQLEYLERRHQIELVKKLFANGVTIKDKNRIDIRGEVNTGSDCILDVNCILEGTVTLGNNVVIGANSIIKNSIIGDDVVVKPFSIIEDAIIAKQCTIGPFARLRPGANLAENVHVGNFVEIKKSQVGSGSKINHLTYVGDAQVGSKVNVGAGTVTCNYDGENKHVTVIEDNVFVGSGTMLVAPVTVGSGGIIGAGSTITKNTPANELTIARAKQLTIIGWIKKMRRINN